MEFLPEDIAGREFLSSVRGFDKEEVNQFLDAVAAQLRDKNRQIKELNEKVRTLEERSSHRADMPTVDPTLLADLQDRARDLVVDLRATIDEVSSLVFELRDSKQVAPELSETVSLIETAEPTESTEPTREAELSRPTVDSGRLRDDQPSVAPPPEWDALLSDPQ